MVFSKISLVKFEFQDYSRLEKFAFFFAMICSFCISFEYAVSRPAINSIFLAHYTHKALPYAWLIVVPLNLIVVGLYNRFLPRLGCLRFFLWTLLFTLILNLFGAQFLGQLPGYSFVLYVWKDIYILLMFQQLWSIIHFMTKMSRAKYLYGFCFGFGGLGTMCGSLIPGFFAAKIGSEYLLFFCIPVYTLFVFAYYSFLKYSGFLDSKKETKQLRVLKEVPSGGFSLVWSSPRLRFILLIVILMQVSSSLMDYQFQSFTNRCIPDTHLRTQFYGRVWTVMGCTNVFLQLFAPFILVQFFGLRTSHFLIPALFLVNGIGYLIYPTFQVMTYSFSFFKSLDYSIFNILKEMLYVPLKTDEKFKAKAVIDVFVYRSSKALGSTLIMLFQAVFPLALGYLPWISIVLMLSWIMAVAVLLKPKESSLVI